MLSSRQVSSQGASTSGRQPAGLPITSRTLSRHQPYLNTTHNDCRNTAIQLLRSPPAVKATGSDSVSDSAPVEQLPEEESEPEDNATVPEATDDELFPTIQFNLPNPVNVKVHTAEYIISSVKVQDCPAPRYPEFAVIGRSNVGKSSLINMLTQRRELALVSKQPGERVPLAHHEVHVHIHTCMHAHRCCLHSAPK